MLDVFRDNSKGKHWMGKLSGLWILYKRLLRRHGLFPQQETKILLFSTPCQQHCPAHTFNSHNMIANVCVFIPTRHLHVMGRDV